MTPPLWTAPRSSQRLRHITVPQMRPFLRHRPRAPIARHRSRLRIVRLDDRRRTRPRTELIWTYAGQLATANSQFGLASAMSMAGVALGVAFTFYLFRQMMRLREDMR